MFSTQLLLLGNDGARSGQAAKASSLKIHEHHNSVAEAPSVQSSKGSSSFDPPVPATICVRTTQDREQAEPDCDFEPFFVDWNFKFN